MTLSVVGDYLCENNCVCGRGVRGGGEIDGNG